MDTGYPPPVEEWGVRPSRLFYRPMPVDPTLGSRESDIIDVHDIDSVGAVDQSAALSVPPPPTNTLFEHPVSGASNLTIALDSPSVSRRQRRFTPVFTTQLRSVHGTYLGNGDVTQQNEWSTPMNDGYIAGWDRASSQPTYDTIATYGGPDTGVASQFDDMNGVPEVSPSDHRSYDPLEQEKCYTDHGAQGYGEGYTGSSAISDAARMLTRSQGDTQFFTIPSQTDSVGYACVTPGKGLRRRWIPLPSEYTCPKPGLYMDANYSHRSFTGLACHSDGRDWSGQRPDVECWPSPGTTPHLNEKQPIIFAPQPRRSINKDVPSFVSSPFGLNGVDLSPPVSDGRETDGPVYSDLNYLGMNTTPYTCPETSVDHTPTSLPFIPSSQPVQGPQRNQQHEWAHLLNPSIPPTPQYLGIDTFYGRPGQGGAKNWITPQTDKDGYEMLMHIASSQRQTGIQAGSTSHTPSVSNCHRTRTDSHVVGSRHKNVPGVSDDGSNNISAGHNPVRIRGVTCQGAVDKNIKSVSVDGKKLWTCIDYPDCDLGGVQASAPKSRCNARAHFHKDHLGEEKVWGCDSCDSQFLRLYDARAHRKASGSRSLNSTGKRTVRRAHNHRINRSRTSPEEV